MYQYKYGSLSNCFNKMCSVTRQVHSYDVDSFIYFIAGLIYFQGPKFFNSLSFEIQYATSIAATFCCKLKAIILS